LFILDNQALNAKQQWLVFQNYYGGESDIQNDLFGASGLCLHCDYLRMFAA
jgi:hypothetical protein